MQPHLRRIRVRSRWSACVAAAAIWTSAGISSKLGTSQSYRHPSSKNYACRRARRFLRTRGGTRRAPWPNMSGGASGRDFRNSPRDARRGKRSTALRRNHYSGIWRYIFGTERVLGADPWS
jgi:hypothetical protein